MTDKHTITIVLTQEDGNINMNAISDPLVKEGESFQPIHLLANEMLNVFFKLKEQEQPEKEEVVLDDGEIIDEEFTDVE